MVECDFVVTGIALEKNPHEAQSLRLNSCNLCLSFIHFSFYCCLLRKGYLFPSPQSPFKFQEKETMSIQYHDADSLGNAVGYHSIQPPTWGPAVIYKCVGLHLYLSCVPCGDSVRPYLGLGLPTKPFVLSRRLNHTRIPGLSHSRTKGK